MCDAWERTTIGERSFLVNSTAVSLGPESRDVSGGIHVYFIMGIVRQFGGAPGCLCTSTLRSTRRVKGSPIPALFSYIVKAGACVFVGLKNV